MSSKQHYDTLLSIVAEQDDIRKVTGTDDGCILDEEILNAIIWAVSNPLDFLVASGYDLTIKIGLPKTGEDE
jgi:hypothetical protein